jgi:hypothetical protein
VSDDRPLDLVRFRRVLNESLRRFPDAEFLLDTRFLLDSYERLLARITEERQFAEQISIRTAIRTTLDRLADDLPDQG